MKKMIPRVIPLRRPGLMQIAVDVVVRSDVAMEAIRLWKSSDEIRRRFGSVADLYDHLVEKKKEEEAREKAKG